MTPPTFLPYCVKAVENLGDRLLLTGANAFESAVLLSREPSVPNRLGAIDQLCPTRIAILQYHDDNVAPVASSEQVAAVCNAADEYTRVHGGTFNMTTGKSAAVPIGHTRFAHDEDMCINGQPLQHASNHPHLGVIIDRWLSFALHVQQLLARAQRAFEDFVGCAQSLGLPLSVQMMVIPARIEAVATYGIEFCIASPGAETVFKRMQAEWAKAFFSVTHCRSGSWICWVAECGWFSRLGTKMLERSIMLKARTRLAPASHPARCALALADAACPTTWAEHVKNIQIWINLSSPVPNIGDISTEHERCLASTCVTSRRTLLTRYRDEWVRPALCQYDHNSMF